MIETMRLAPGVGLAAPQIGLSERIIVIEYLENEEDEDKEDAPKKVWAVLNPEIIKASEETLLGVEGCLSIPNLVGEVERHVAVQVKGLFFQAKDGIRDVAVTGVQTCALPI